MDQAVLNVLIEVRNNYVACREVFTDAIETQAEKLKVSPSALRKVVEANAKADQQKLEKEIDDIQQLLN